MPIRVTANRCQEFLDKLVEFGRSTGNRRFREALGWDEEFYWKVQGKLHQPDPARLDRFLIDLPSEYVRKQLSKWKG